MEDRITHGPLPAGDVLRYAAQIADALDHAHQAQITHRDLKPSNVMLTSTGVKLLDFGLARGPVLEATGSGASTQSLSPPGRLTAEGTVIGTFQYMAPEQLEGKDADARTDIFAFGSVLFEMATGRKAFEGSSQASLIASILTAAVPAMSTTRSESRTDALPYGIDHIIERCLAKNPNERWQTARDLTLELQWIAAEGSRASATRHTTAHSRSRRTLLWVGAAITATAIAAVLVDFNQFHATPPPDTIRFNIAVPSGSTIARGITGTKMALSPDGRRIAFVTTSGGVDRLWVQSLDSLTAQPLADGVESPFWSPDSQFVGFFAPGEGALKKVAVTGGPAAPICPAAVADVATWHANGTILFAQSDGGSGGIFPVSADGRQADPTDAHRFDAAGNQPCVAGLAAGWSSIPVYGNEPRRERETRATRGLHPIDRFRRTGAVDTRGVQDLGNDTAPMWSPDGRQVVFSSDRGGAPDLFVKTTDGLTSEQVLLAQRGNQVANDWAPDGTFILFEENNRETDGICGCCRSMATVKPGP